MDFITRKEIKEIIKKKESAVIGFQIMDQWIFTTWMDITGWSQDPDAKHS